MRELRELEGNMRDLRELADKMRGSGKLEVNLKELANNMRKLVENMRELADIIFTTSSTTSCVAREVKRESSFLRSAGVMVWSDGSCAQIATV